MIISVPVVIERIDRLHTVKALFVPDAEVSHHDLNRSITRFRQRLQMKLVRIGESERHEELARCSFCPDFEVRKDVAMQITLRRRTARCRFLFVIFRHFYDFVASCQSTSYLSCFGCYAFGCVDSHSHASSLLDGCLKFHF